MNEGFAFVQASPGQSGQDVKLTVSTVEDSTWVNVQGTLQIAGRSLTNPAVPYTSCAINTGANLSMSPTYVPQWEGYGAVPPTFLLYFQSLCIPRGHIGGEKEVQHHLFLTSALDLASGPGNSRR